jgi:hypothetical protein
MLSDSGCRILDAKAVHQSGGAPQNFLGHFFLAQVAVTILWRLPDIEPSGQNAGNQLSKSQWVSFSHLGQNRRPMLSPSSMHVANEILRGGVELLEQEVDAGGSIHARLTLVPYAGREIQQTVTIPIPRHLAGEKVTLEFEPGYLVQKERASPDTLTELVANLEDATYPPKSLVVGYNDGSGVAFRGRVATQLPPGAFDVLRPTSATIAPAAFESQTRHVIMLDQFLIGKDRATLEVRPVRR